jgi:hypothetical protein
MVKITYKTPNDAHISPKDVVKKSANVVDAMARWFGADVEAIVSNEPNPQGGENRRVVSFHFSGDRADEARKNVGIFLENSTDIGSAFIKPSQTDKLKETTSVKMDLGMLATFRRKDFKAAEFYAGHNGSIISQRVSGEQGRGIAV